MPRSVSKYQAIAFSLAYTIGHDLGTQMCVQQVDVTTLNLSVI